MIMGDIQNIVQLARGDTGQSEQMLAENNRDSHVPDWISVLLILEYESNHTSADMV